MSRRIIRLPDVSKRTSLSKASIYRLIAAGDFPAPVKMGSASGWFEDEIDAWMQRLDEARKEPEPA